MRLVWVELKDYMFSGRLFLTGVGVAANGGGCMQHTHHYFILKAPKHFAAHTLSKALGSQQATVYPGIGLFVYI